MRLKADRGAPDIPTSFAMEELESLESRLRKELENRGGVYEIVVAFGRKP